MTRDLCVELVSVRDGLERRIPLELEFVGMGYSRTCKEKNQLVDDYSNLMILYIFCS